MRINSIDEIHEKPKDNLKYYIFAIIGGLIIFFVFLYFFKFLKMIFGLTKLYWVWLVLGFFVLIIIKRLWRKN